jgi:hypothetical protein
MTPSLAHTVVKEEDINGEYKIFWKEVVVAKLKFQPLYYPVATEENHENSQS